MAHNCRFLAVIKITCKNNLPAQLLKVRKVSKYWSWMPRTSARLVVVALNHIHITHHLPHNIKHKNVDDVQLSVHIVC